MTAIPISTDAPPWAADAMRKVGALIDEARLGPFVSFTPLDASGSLPDAAKNKGKIILIHSAASSAPMAVSDGADWIDTTGAAL